MERSTRPSHDDVAMSVQPASGSHEPRPEQHEVFVEKTASPGDVTTVSNVVSRRDSVSGGGTDKITTTTDTILHSMAACEPHPPFEGYSDSDELEHARAREYLLLATLLNKAPTQALLDEIAAIPADVSPLGLAHAALAKAARTTDQVSVAREFFQLFVGVGRGDVLPYASFYRTGFLNGRPLAHVRAELARLGITRGEHVFEPEDHLGTLLEIMAGLIAGAFGQPAADAAATEARFFTEHIAPWGQRAFEDVMQAPAAGFYRAVGDLGRLWLEIETQAFVLSGQGAGQAPRSGQGTARGNSRR